MHSHNLVQILPKIVQEQMFLNIHNQTQQNHLQKSFSLPIMMEQQISKNKIKIFRHKNIEFFSNGCFEKPPNHSLVYLNLNSIIMIFRLPKIFLPLFFSFFVRYFSQFIPVCICLLKKKRKKETRRTLKPYFFFCFNI